MPPVYSEALTQEPSQPQQDDAASPEHVCHTRAQRQAQAAGQRVEFYYQMFQELDDLLTSCSPDSRPSIETTMMEATAKLRDNARIHNMAACSLEVAAPLYLIFTMMIPVM